MRLASISLLLSIASVQVAPDSVSFVVLGHVTDDPSVSGAPLRHEPFREVARLKPDALFLAGDLILGDERPGA